MIKILFICAGNYCRSPMAFGYFRKRLKDLNLTDQVEIGTAGTHQSQVGKSPHEKSQTIAKEHQFDISDIVARQIQEYEFEYYDLIVCMDEDNLLALKRMSDPIYHSKIRLLTDFSIPDPYVTDEPGFQKVFKMIQEGCEGLLEYTKDILKKSKKK